MIPAERDADGRRDRRGKPENPAEDGSWRDPRWVHGKHSQLYGTAVGCFILAIPNRYLPILQEGKIEGLREKLGK